MAQNNIVKEIIVKGFLGLGVQSKFEEGVVINRYIPAAKLADLSDIAEGQEWEGYLWPVRDTGKKTPKKGLRIAKQAFIPTCIVTKVDISGSSSASDNYKGIACVMSGRVAVNQIKITPSVAFEDGPACIVGVFTYEYAGTKRIFRKFLTLQEAEDLGCPRKMLTSYGPKKIKDARTARQMKTAVDKEIGEIKRLRTAPHGPLKGTARKSTYVYQVAS